jgi:hypothetical protein
MSKELISICGLPCHECGAYVATQSNDDAKRAEVAAMWSKMYDAEIVPEAINCDGCSSQGERVFQHCTVCEIRKCGIERGLDNCAHCDDYVCKKLESFFEMVPDNRARLDAIKKGL